MPAEALPNHSVRVVAAILCVVEAAALAALCVLYVLEIIRGASDSLGRAVVGVLLIALVALGLAVLAKGWLGTAAWARTPTMVWNALLLPVALSLAQSGHPALGLLVGAVALAALVAAVVARSADQP